MCGGDDSHSVGSKEDGDTHDIGFCCCCLNRMLGGCYSQRNEDILHRDEGALIAVYTTAIPLRWVSSIQQADFFLGRAEPSECIVSCISSYKRSSF